MKKLLRPLLTIVIILIVAALIILPKFSDRLFNRQGPPQVQSSGRPGSAGGTAQPGGGMRGGQMLNVSAMIISPSIIREMINSTGSLIPDEEVELSFETSGKIVAIYFNEGTQVKKGDLLAKINDRHLQAQLMKLEAQKQLAQDKEFRQRSLLDRDAISRASYDQIVTELQAIEADIMLIKARIAETELRAPFDGIIGLRYLSEGSFASTSTKIARLVKNRPLKIEFSIAERYAGEIRPGYPITFRIDGSENIFSASVYALDPKVDLRTRTILVRATYPNRNEELKPGRFAAITLRLAEVTDAVSIPTEALIPEMDGEKVFVYRSGRAMPVKVSTGLRTESTIQITNGLQFGDTLITSGILQLRQGLPVVLDNVIVQNQQEQKL